MAPWPNQPCPHCGNTITDLLAEMVPGESQKTAGYAALVKCEPGGSIACPYCQGSVEYATNGDELRVSLREPLRYSRHKVEDRAKKFAELFLERPDCSPEEWIAQDRMMPGALRGYRYAEDRP
jgi:hypothetical protein